MKKFLEVSILVLFVAISVVCGFEIYELVKTIIDNKDVVTYIALDITIDVLIVTIISSIMFIIKLVKSKRVVNVDDVFIEFDDEEFEESDDETIEE